MSAGRLPERVVVRSPAKLNLDLRVCGRRPDGFHEVDTTLVALDRCDRVEVARVGGVARARGAVELALDGPALTDDVRADPSNLAWRAAAGVLALAGSSDGLALSIEKRVPSRAGLGGGSANAAAAALGAAALLGIDPDEPDLIALLSGLGADCAFFLVARASGAARCRGRGERVEAIESLAPRMRGRAFLVLTPEIGTSTAEVYGSLRDEERRSERPPLDVEAWLAAPLERARAALFNGLEAAALRTSAALAGWRARLDEVGGAHFRLAGSGSSFFGLFEDAAAARAFRDELVSRKARDHGLRASFVASVRGAGVALEEKFPN